MRNGGRIITNIFCEVNLMDADYGNGTIIGHNFYLTEAFIASVR